MSLRLLEENWSVIQSKVIEPLWRGEFKLGYESVKMDEKDFYSLAGYELTKAFLTYNPEKSNILTFSTNVLKKKARTELRDRKRKKRAAEVYAESIYQPIGENDETIEDIIECSSDVEDDKENSVQDVVDEMKKILRPKEIRVVELTLFGFNNETIAKALKISAEDVLRIKKRVSNSSAITRIISMAGFLGGNANED